MAFRNLRYSCFGIHWGLLIVTVVAALLWADVAAAQTTVVRVEEDWELVGRTPDPNTDAPQVSCALSPVGNVDSLYGVFVINHQSLPTFVRGGLQLQVWNDEQAVDHRKFPSSAMMVESNETVRWTQSVQLTDNSLSFEITNGSSTTWGTFGGQGYLKAIVATSLGNLNAYDPSVSVANSGVSYAGNRVQSLILKRVRLVNSDGTITEDSTERVVYQQD